MGVVDLGDDGEMGRGGPQEARRVPVCLLPGLWDRDNLAVWVDWLVVAGLLLASGSLAADGEESLEETHGVVVASSRVVGALARREAVVGEGWEMQRSCFAQTPKVQLPPNKMPNNDRVSAPRHIT